MVKNQMLMLTILFIMVLSILNCTNKPEVLIKAKTIHAKVLTVDTHCDTPLHMEYEDWDIGKYHNPKDYQSGKIDLPRMKAGGQDVEFFAAYVGQRDRTPGNYLWAALKVENLITLVHDMCNDYPDLIRLATTPDEAYANEKNGLLTAYIGIENGFAIGKDIQNIRKYYDMGVRYITLCHTRNNDICDSSTDKKGPEHHGLSEFGKQVVAEMNKLGMIVDVSHISDESFYDVLETSKTPVMASHSNARAICDNPRNLTDDMIKALAQKDGVIQMCVFSGYVKTSKPNPKLDNALKALTKKYGSWSEIKDEALRKQYSLEYHKILDKYDTDKATVKDFVDHIDHVVGLVGINYVGIGTDFDGGGGLADCYDISEMPNITIELVKRGYSEQDIEKIWGGNFMRMFRKVVESAEMN